MLNPLFEAACCGLKAIEQSLLNNKLPVPQVSQVIHHDIVLDCSCDALYVTIGETRDVSDQYFEDGTGRVTNPLTACPIGYWQVEFEVSLTRCVHLKNPLDKECWPNEDCSEHVACPPDDTPLPEPSNFCDTAPQSKAEETRRLLDDRWTLETIAADLWTRCLCEGWCDSDGDCGMGCRSAVRWVSSSRFDSGGCAGTSAVYEMTFV